MTDLADQFLELEIDPAKFDHEAHVRVAFTLLRRYSFVEATKLFADRLVALTERIGQPDKFNLTITLALMALIAERMQATPQDEFEVFIAKNQDLLDMAILQRWYSKERLWSSQARSTFLLPDACVA